MADSRSKQSSDDTPSVVSTDSSSSSSSSGDSINILPLPLSSPANGPQFSDAVRRHTRSGGSRKKARFEMSYLQSPPMSSAQKPPRRSHSARRSHKSRTVHVPSSPPCEAYPTGTQYSFTNHSPPSSPPPSSAVDDPSLPALYHGSPPQTPPPSRAHPGLRKRKAEEGADLLLYLATSPTPATHSGRPAATGGASTHGSMFPPSTPPPSKSAGLPSSAAGEFFPAASPLGTFNFSDYVNVTPSPAQAPFSRTPGGAGSARTPLAAREARRKLNFDSLMPPGASPNITRAGLGMELGGELAS